MTIDPSELPDKSQPIPWNETTQVATQYFEIAEGAVAGRKNFKRDEVLFLLTLITQLANEVQAHKS